LDANSTGDRAGPDRKSPKRCSPTRRAAAPAAPPAAVAEAVRLLPAPLATTCPELLVDYLLEVFDGGDARPVVAGDR
jgi:hypothetical protein